MICGADRVKRGSKSMKRLNLLKNFPMGLLIGWIAAMLLAWAIDGAASDHIAKNWTYVFTVIASLIASSLALWVGLAAIENQNENLRKAKDDNSRSAKAVLPLAVSEFYRMAGNMFEISLNDPVWFSLPDNRDQVRRSLKFEGPSIKILRDCIKSGDDVSSNWLGVLIARYQIYASRSESLIDTKRAPSEHELVSVALDWAVQREISGHCFPYARGAVQVVPPILLPSSLSLPKGGVHYMSRRYGETSDALERLRHNLGDGHWTSYSEAI